ncbi:MAG: DUF190 domain-containing protein [Gemmataceae bacterium]|nr:DUF190 domain-containing protein [Gemmataceae bacterium]MDW8267455.1 DUF190 domain-containing protein [Gemmataceae bacterium]
MPTSGRGTMVRLFLGPSDTYRDQPLARAVLERAAGEGMLMAGVFRAESGYGASRQLRTWVSGDVPPDFPLVIEMLGLPEDAQRLIAALDRMLADGLVATEAVEIWATSGRGSGPCPGPRG